MTVSGCRGGRDGNQSADGECGNKGSDTQFLLTGGAGPRGSPAELLRGLLGKVG
jgi:hypothetical protein